MNRLQRGALLTELTDYLGDAGSWCGETHLQKATYFVQGLLAVPVGFDFVLYKFGPYSFELGDDLTALCADGLLELFVRHAPYGPSLRTTSASTELRRRFSVTLGRYSPHLKFVALTLGSKGVAELERLATALYVTREAKKGESARNRAARLRELKPHVSLTSANAAVEEFDGIASEAGSRFAECSGV